MDFVRQLYRTLEDVRRTVQLLRRGLVRLGTVSEVDTTACTVVVEYPGEAADGGPLKSPPMPWLQRSTEHRPPAAGDHALVIDPSLGRGAGLAITGWPSTARPPPEGGGDQHVLYAGSEPTLIKSDASIAVESDDVQLASASDYVALAAKVDAEIQRIWDLFSNWVPVAQDGGAALQTLASASSAGVQSVAGEHVKAS